MSDKLKKSGFSSQENGIIGELVLGTGGFRKDCYPGRFSITSGYLYLYSKLILAQ